jgi:hypothetical protein
MDFISTRKIRRPESFSGRLLCYVCRAGAKGLFMPPGFIYRYRNQGTAFLRIPGKCRERTQHLNGPADMFRFAASTPGHP